MGGIDLDPFSCALANEVIKADWFMSEDGFGADWRGLSGPARVFCNPPGGKLSRKDLSVVKAGPGFSSAAVAWAKLMHEYEIGNVEQAIFIGFTLEILRTSQGFGPDVPPCSEFSLCFPRDRLRFWNEHTEPGTGQPTHPNVIVYVPPRDGIAADRACSKFLEYFSQFGAVRL
jgi:hypothetical protein